MKKNELTDILEKHKRWLNGDPFGIVADLTDSDLTEAYLRFADLKFAKLRDAYLKFADLRNAHLRGADLREANLRETDLRGADLRDTFLIGADLEFADLRETDLRGADLRDTFLIGANLEFADLRGADLRGADYDYKTTGLNLSCPEKGSFIGFKKAKGKIVELLILDDALRSSATSKKCRCSKAKVISITSIDKKETFDQVSSNYDRDFIYKVGEIVEVEDFDTNRWNECSTGIHFFITRKEAEEY